MPPSSISGKETKKNNTQLYFVVKHSLWKNQLKSANRTQCSRHLLAMIGDKRIHGLSQKRKRNPFLGATSYHHDFIAAKKCGYVVKRRRLILEIIFLRRRLIPPQRCDARLDLVVRVQGIHPKSCSNTRSISNNKSKGLK